MFHWRRKVKVSIGKPKKVQDPESYAESRLTDNKLQLCAALQSVKTADQSMTIRSFVFQNDDSTASFSGNADNDMTDQHK